MTLTSEERLRRAELSLAVVVALLATSVSMTFFDRPVALWSNRVLYGTWAFRASAFLLTKFEPIGELGAILFLAGAVGWSVNRRTPTWIKRFVIGAACAAVAILVTEFLKWACGRSAAYPLFLVNHIYAFRPFNGNPNYMDFPSGTLTVVVGFVTGWAPARLFQRTIAGLMIALSVVALIVANGHWISDIIAGSIVGWAVASGISLLFDRFRQPRRAS